MIELDKEKMILIGCVASSFVAYHTARQVYSYLSSQPEEWIPIGTVKSLHIYPIKSCKPIDLFAFKCTKLGPVMGELEDRAFMVVDEATGRFVTARQKPKLVHLVCKMESGTLEVTVPGKPAVIVDMKKVLECGKLIRSTMFRELKQDGLDCGDEVAKLLSDFIEEPNHRLIYHREGLYTERSIVPEDEWWNNNPLPKGVYDSQFTDFFPFHICTSASMIALNERMENKVSSREANSPFVNVSGLHAQLPPLHRSRRMPSLG